MPVEVRSSEGLGLADGGGKDVPEAVVNWLAEGRELDEGAQGLQDTRLAMRFREEVAGDDNQAFELDFAL